MRNIYKLLSLVFAFFASTGVGFAQEDSRWEIADNWITEITPGQTVVIQEGPGKSFTKSRFLSPTELSPTVNKTCVYKFVLDGECEIEGVGTIPAYNLLNVSSNEYLGDDGNYTRSQKEAFRFTAALAKEVDGPSNWGQVGQDFWYNSCKKDDNVGAEDNCFVFAGVKPNGTSPRYICFTWSASYPNLIMQYYNCNVWYVIPATEYKLSMREKFDAALAACFPSGVEGVYAPGTDFGTYGQAEYDRAIKVYQEAVAASSDETLTDEQLEALITELYAAKAALDASFKTIVPGYYFIGAHRSSWDGMTTNGSNLISTPDYVVPDADTLKLEDLNYIWKLEATNFDGWFYFKNMGTNQYCATGGGTSAVWPVSATSKDYITLWNYGNGRFNIIGNGGKMMHSDGQHRVVTWNNADDGAGQWSFVPVTEESMAQLIEQQNRLLLLDSIRSVIGDAESAMVGLDVTFDGNYGNRKGLVTTATGNANDSSEGTIANLFDGNVGTFYSTSWHTLALDNDYDWIQVDFGHEVQHLYLKMTRRHNNGQNDPTRIRLTKQGEDPAETVWSNILYEDTVVYTYHTDGITMKPIGTTNPNAVAGDSATAVMEITLKEPASVLRMSVMKTIANDMKNGERDLGPLWNLSELRFYEDLNDDPRYKLIPAAVRNALQEAVDNAKAALDDGTATREDYVNLIEALDAFWASYPDPSELEDIIEKARALAEAAAEGPEIGYYQLGAKQTVLDGIAAIEGEMGDDILTLEQINAFIAQVEELLADFDGKLNKPEDGKLYRIVSASTNESVIGNMLYCINADTETSLRWGYLDDANVDTRLNTIWQCTKNDDGTYALRNLAFGRYFGNLYTDKEADEVALSVSLYPAAEAETVNLVGGPAEGCFNIQLADNRFVNAQPSSNLIVIWNSPAANSLFKFEEVDEDDLALFNTIDIPAATTQIITQPYAIDADGSSPKPLKLIGKMTEDDGVYAQFVEWEGIIPAGTPFLVQTTEEESTTMFIMAAETASDLLNDPEGYVYGNVEQNGLVGCLRAEEIPAELGIIIDDRIQLSEKNDVVAAGTGYFKEIPETTEEGTVKVRIDGVINGIGNTVVNNGPAAIYTLAGVKVNSSVKQLPKGLYIVNGKKVIVK